MPRIPSVSPVTGQPLPAHYIHTVDGQFVDTIGRTLLLRGVNLSGSSKAPVGHPSYIQTGFWEDAENGGRSFVGRPLNLDDGSADIHLSRLRGWGFNTLRYPVTWEALEHEGPGKYDHEFMDYTVRVLRKCKEYGFKVYMDPHQDVWSRFSGGSGAPYWTLLACGINPRNFSATQAAIVHCDYPNQQNPDPLHVPAMIWSTNYARLANQTLFTLFFAGRDFAPNCIIDDVNIQDYLQSHYISAFGILAEKIRDAGDLLDECVIGWDTMNEPSEGLVGHPDLNKYEEQQTNQLKKGSTPTPAQSLRLGMGQKQTVDSWTFGAFGPSKDGTVTIDPKGRKMWLDPEAEPGGVSEQYGWRRDSGWKLGTCIWAQHGVWDVETGYVMLPEYFKSLSSDEEKEVEFISDYWRPHWSAYSKRIKEVHPEAIHFVAPPVFAQPPPIDEKELQGRCCYSTHYYDGLTLLTRHWNWFNADALGVLRGKYRTILQSLKIGERSIRKSIQEQLGILKTDADILGSYPTMIGEIGIPYDMDSRRAYGYTDNGKYKGDYSSQEKALDASLNAADGPNGLSYTVWTYCPDNEHRWGDGWNMEDLSLWSPDDLRLRKGMMNMGAEGTRSGSRMALGNMDDKSSTLLIKKNNNNNSNNCDNYRNDGSRRSFGVHVPQTSSAYSLSSLPPDESGGHRRGESDNDDATTLLNSYGADRWDGDLTSFDFLTDGARAYKAFSRPYPMATVGIPSDMSFDIQKAEYNLTLRVRPEDATVEPPPPPPPRDSTATLLAEKQDYRPPTEIFLPVVHYASDMAVGSSLLAQSTDTEDPSSTNTIDRSEELEETYPPGSGVGGASKQGATNLAVEVEVSEGRWDVVEGGILRWWYDVPQAGAPTKEVKIKVTRRGGRIWTKEEREREGGWEKVWKESCGEANCTIM